MKEKTQALLKIVLIICLLIGTLIFKFIPEYKNSQGSSDTYIKTNTYDGIIELKIDSGTNLILITSNSNLTNILFLDNKSLCLYNKDIENTSLASATEKIIALLVENNYLTPNSVITLTKYTNSSYQTFKNYLTKSLSEISFPCNIVEQESTLKEKAQVLNTTSSSDETSTLKEIELYSKDLIRRYKNYALNEPASEKESFTKENAQKYAQTVYEKLTSYAKKNNITSQEIFSSSMPIDLIPANNTGTIYPSPSSWYYIKDSKVYAYINIVEGSQNYDFCFQGAIDEYKEGPCQ